MLTLYDANLEKRMADVMRETHLLIARSQYYMNRHIWPTT